MTRIPLRPPEQVMTLSRLGSLHQCRLSFMRQLLRRMKQENWSFTRPHFDINTSGEGFAVYTSQGPTRAYSLIAFAHDLPDDMRSDRVIATAWDATFALFDGTPNLADIERLRANVPLQEAGRVSETELSISRANRSARLWNATVETLAKGQQPDADVLANVGYLMRTTAVYGSGKFGAADRASLEERPEFSPPFQVEMLSVYLIRAFVADLVEHMAKVRSPNSAVPLAPGLRRGLGIGNSTGLGMAPFLLNHPRLLNNWISARERALATIRSLASADSTAHAFLSTYLHAKQSIGLWHSEHPLQKAKLKQLAADIQMLDARLESFDFTQPQAWNALYLWAENTLSEEGQELLVSLMLEPHADLVDSLGPQMQADESTLFMIDGAMPAETLSALICTHYDWALQIDWTAPQAIARLWYVSEEKLEPRLCERANEPLEDYEQPLAPARDICRMFGDLHTFAGNTAAFLQAHPEHRSAARRVQMRALFPYSEVCDNTIDAKMLPIDMLRAKLSFFGATNFDPRSDRWVRINMFRGAPYPSELSQQNSDDWVYGVVK
ncbi:hypothetical protein KO498_14380 [Lentibacter algarum]|uniref:hypothetical protein n=1 Tax=Lentibacter algarum TaxID=576131 RepID=UPI001C0A489B|nr:hypothetical protein [Lentibacter algarum]MBU2983002.1 hypothetical protein [Lentibacter algarum]